MSLKHTPGKWELCDRGDYSDFDGMSQVILGNDMRIGVVHSYDDEGESNARLIASAPEMLEIIISDLRINLKFMSFGDITFMRQETNSEFNKKIDIVEKATGMTIEEVLNVTD